MLENDKDRRTLDKNNDKNQTSPNHAKSELFRKAYNNFSTVLMVQSKSSAVESSKKQKSPSSKVQFTWPVTERQPIGEKNKVLSLFRAENKHEKYYVFLTVHAFLPIITVWKKVHDKLHYQFCILNLGSQGTQEVLLINKISTF